MEKNDLKIDLVYLWVDGSDPVWQARKMAATGNFSEDTETDGKARYENNDELKYSLRSAEKYVPWIRKVFIVTDNQIPAWLDTSNPRVQIVDHSEILPTEAMPCYNSIVIEHYLYKIPDLAERFLLSNDDTFFGKPLSPDFFFAADGYPIVRIRRKTLGRFRSRLKQSFGKDIGQYRRMILRSAISVKRATGKYFSGIPHHNIDAHVKSDYARAAEEVFREEVERSNCNHTRAENDIERFAFSLYSLAIEHAHRELVNERTSCYISAHVPDIMARYLKFSPSLFCLNDNPRVSEQDRVRIKPFLDGLFPDKSSFEK